MGRKVKNPFTGEEVDLEAWDAGASPAPSAPQTPSTPSPDFAEPPSAPSAPAAPAPPPPGAPTWGNRGGTPQSDPYTNYINRPQPAAPPRPAASAPAPTAFSEQRVRDAWAASPDHSPAALAALAAQHGLRVEGDTIILPDGRRIDAVMDEGGRNDPGWLDLSQADRISRGSTGADSRFIGGGGGSRSLSSGMAALGVGSSGLANDWQTQIRSMLLAQLQGLSTPIDENDPTIRGEMTAQEQLAERVRRDRRAAMAERAAASGLNSGGAGSGAFEADIASGFEDKKQGLAGLQAQLFGRELTSRRSQLANLLNMALSTGDAESARSLQMAIAQMDAELQRLGLKQQKSMFDDQFGRQLARDAEDDFRWNFDRGFGG